MIKKLFITGCVLGIIGAVFGYYTFNKPHKSASDAAADFTMSAKELFTAFETDETNSNQKYIGKLVEVSGTVIGTANSGFSKSVTLNADAMMGGVVFELDSAYAATLQALPDSGKVVKLKGFCNGYLSDVELNRAVIVE